MAGISSVRTPWPAFLVHCDRAVKLEYHFPWLQKKPAAKGWKHKQRVGEILEIKEHREKEELLVSFHIYKQEKTNKIQGICEIIKYIKPYAILGWEDPVFHTSWFQQVASTVDRVDLFTSNLEWICLGTPHFKRPITDLTAWHVCPESMPSCHVHDMEWGGSTCLLGSQMSYYSQKTAEHHFHMMHDKAEKLLGNSLK